ncbi:hypothetical protein GQX73_g9462 [Xylaria multiplex]|uniref:Infection structure specific protein n=1 Tax=Xylaria multiplex TaxID=323545 RepID=A0A7C8MGM2_9PEZI|nr:hypothetical protein GQX73_g9462 [Xylaria multiplex]
MHSTKALLSVASLIGMALAQNDLDPECTRTISSLIAEGPTIPAVLSPYLVSAVGDTVRTVATATITSPPDTLADPEGYVQLLCSVAGELPSSLLPNFESWGAELLSFGSAHISIYDAYVTQCVTTGEAAASITSYLNALLTGTAGFCQPTATLGNTPNGTISTTPVATATYVTNSTTSIPTTSVITGAATKPTGVFVGAAAIGGLIGAVALL